MPTNHEKHEPMRTYQERFAAAYDYWEAHGAPPPAARDLAHEQIEWEDASAEGESWKGPNDSLQLHSY